MRSVPLTVLLALSAHIFGAEPVDEILVVFLAREAVKQRFPQMATDRANVERRGSGEYITFTVLFETPVPDGFWGYRANLYGEVDGKSGKVTMDLWRNDAAGDVLPHPQGIAQRFLIPPKGCPKEPDRAIALIQRWLDVHRNDNSIDFVYDRFSWAHREAELLQPLIDALNRERTLATNPRALYCIYAELAKAFAVKGEVSSALEMWDMARASVVNAGSHPWFTTRRDLPLYEKALVHHNAGQFAKAEEGYRAYLKTEYGRREAREASLKLGAMLEAHGRVDEAAAVYRAYIAIPAKNPNPRFVKDFEAPFHDRLKLIDARKRMAEENVPTQAK